MIYGGHVANASARHRKQERWEVKRPDPLGLKCDTITSPRRLVTTFITSNNYRV
jgi:hypothetical protein